MNYLRELVAFHRFRQGREINASAIALWLALMELANQLHWPQRFSVSAAELACASGQSVNSVFRARAALQALGLIRFEPGAGRHSAVYTLCSVIDCLHGEDGVQTGVQSGVQTGVQTGVQSGVQCEPEGLISGGFAACPKTEIETETETETQTIGESQAGAAQPEEEPAQARGETPPSETAARISMGRKDERARTSDRVSDRPAPPRRTVRLTDGPRVCRPPTPDEVRAYCLDAGLRVDAERFVDFYAARGWRLGTTPMADWRALVRVWHQRGDWNGAGTGPPGGCGRSPWTARPTGPPGRSAPLREQHYAQRAARPEDDDIPEDQLAEMLGG